MKRVLITGKNSYIGTSLKKWLQKEPEKYIVDSIDLRDELWNAKNFSLYDTVFHVAAIVHKKEKTEMRDIYFKVNRDLSIEVAKKAKDSGVKQFIFMSTMAVYGENGMISKKVVINKHTPINPKTLYGISKAEAEKAISELNDDKFSVVVLRPPIVYGNNCSGNYALLEKLATKIPIFPLIDNERSMIHIDKLCQNLKYYIDTDSFGIYLPQDDKYINTSTLIKELALLKGRNIILSKTLGNIIKLFGNRIQLLNKVFGNLTYERDYKGIFYNKNEIIVEPKYSVLMSVYHKERPENLKESVESMLRQTVLPSEIVLVKDGPLNEELDNIINQYRNNPIIKIINLEENVGLGRALNIGLIHCQNELIARMDTDDISEPNRCEKQLEKLIYNNNISVIGSSVAEFIDTTDNIVALKEVVESHYDIKKRMKYRNPINHPTVMFRKKDVLMAGNYEHWFLNEDYYLWVRMINKGFIFENINEPLVKMRITNETYYRRGGWKYFITQKRLFDYMLKIGFINFGEYLYNNVIRLLTKTLMSNKMRKLVYIKFLRKKAD
jgi:UDP-glucose 4-epimerase